MPWGAAIAGGAALLGSAMSADAAGDAAAGQQQATQQANMLQYQMFRENQALQQPTITAGNAARDRLQYRLGLSPTGTSGAPAPTYDSLRQQMLGEYTRSGQPGGGAVARTPDSLNNDMRRAYDGLVRSGADQSTLSQFLAEADGGNVVGRRALGPNDNPNALGEENYGPSGGTSYVDESGLDAAIRARMAQQDAATAAERQRALSDPAYGDLAREYVAERYTPDKFSFKREDFQADPGYQFRLEQGQKALDRKAAAGGRFFSGSALTGASNFAGDMASNEYGNVFNRALNTFGTNEGNRRGAFQMNEGNRFGAYQANFNNAVNPLLSLAGAATLGSQNLGSAGASYAGQVGNALTNNANAQGAAGIATANQIGNSLTSGVNNYQQNQLMQQMLNRNQSPWASVNNNPYPVGANYAGDNAGWQG